MPKLICIGRESLIVTRALTKHSLDSGREVQAVTIRPFPASLRHREQNVDELTELDLCASAGTVQGESMTAMRRLLFDVIIKKTL